MRSEVDMHAGKKTTCWFAAMCRDSCVLEDVVRVVGVAELALSLPIVTGAGDLKL